MGAIKMKGPKIEDLRDPKWLGKKIIKSSDEDEWMKVLYQGTHECFVVDNRNMEGNAPYKFHYWDAHNPFDWHEWIEPTKKLEKPLKFPFNVGDKIKYKTFTKNIYAEILKISGPVYLDYFEIFVKKHNYFNAEKTEDKTYHITPEEFRDWELWINPYPPEPKKKKTILILFVE